MVDRLDGDLSFDTGRDRGTSITVTVLTGSPTDARRAITDAISSSLGR